MTSRIRLGCFSYLNTLPLYHDILQTTPPPFEVTSEIPSVINRLFLEKKIDISLISTFSWLQNKANCDLIPTHCVGSDGAVHSVNLLSKFPLDQLNGKTIGLTSASATSRWVLRILCEEYYHFKVNWEEWPSSSKHLSWEQDFDAVLVIGDDALLAQKNKTLRIYDVGELWKEATGAPIIFAVLVKQKEVSDKTAQLVTSWFSRSLKHYHEHPEKVHCLVKRDKPLVLNPERYFKDLNYMFSEDSQEAILVYEQHLNNMGILGPTQK